VTKTALYLIISKNQIFIWKFISFLHLCLWQKKEEYTSLMLGVWKCYFQHPHIHMTKYLIVRCLRVRIVSQTLIDWDLCIQFEVLFFFHLRHASLNMWVVFGHGIFYSHLWYSRLRGKRFTVCTEIAIILWTVRFTIRGGRLRYKRYDAHF